MHDESSNPMDRDYRPYGIDSPTNAEIWNHRAEQMQADSVSQRQRDGERRSGAWTGNWRPPADLRSTTRAAGFWILLGVIALGFASRQEGDARTFITVAALVAIGLSAMQVAGALLRTAMERLAPVLKPALAVAIVLAIAYAMPRPH